MVVVNVTYLETGERMKEEEGWWWDRSIDVYHILGLNCVDDDEEMEEELEKCLSIFQSCLVSEIINSIIFSIVINHHEFPFSF